VVNERQQPRPDARDSSRTWGRDLRQVGDRSASRRVSVGAKDPKDHDVDTVQPTGGLDDRPRIWPPWRRDREWRQAPDDVTSRGDQDEFNDAGIDHRRIVSRERVRDGSSVSSTDHVKT
jgi:hypothetical protein